MLDNTNLTPFLRIHLRDMPYQNMVEAYDTQCAFCPFKKIQLRKSGKLLKETYDELYIAIDEALIHDSTIVRACGYGEEYYTLAEIISNTCRLWNDKTIEGGDNELEPAFIIVEDEEKLEIRDIRKEYSNKVIF